jgi:maltose alpha-D-glucosyltransferase/alpha-amylase
MRYEWQGQVVLAVHDFADERRDVTLELDAPPAAVLVNLLSRDHTARGEDGRYRVSLEGYGYRWYRLATEGEAVP